MQKEECLTVFEKVAIGRIGSKVSSFHQKKSNPNPTLCELAVVGTELPKISRTVCLNMYLGIDMVGIQSKRVPLSSAEVLILLASLPIGYC